MFNSRKLHRYLGVFFTPAILFFAFTGALQTFGLHESEQHGEPPPVAWIAALASLHKDQRLPEPRQAKHEEAPAAMAPPAAAPAAPSDHDAQDHAKKSTLPLKLFVLALAVGLCASSLLGLYIALSNPRTRKETTVVLALGILFPLLLLLM
jgi:hypothetical protein